jgi:hypothetical protein
LVQRSAGVWGSGASSILPNAAEIAIGAGDPVFGPLPGRPNYDGAVGGGEIGYNARFGNWLAGVEADISAAGMSGSNTAVGVPFIGGTFSTTLERSSTGSVRSGVGWAFWQPTTCSFTAQPDWRTAIRRRG